MQFEMHIFIFVFYPVVIIVYSRLGLGLQHTVIMWYMWMLSTMVCRVDRCG